MSVFYGIDERLRHARNRPSVRGLLHYALPSIVAVMFACVLLQPVRIAFAGPDDDGGAKDDAAVYQTNLTAAQVGGMSTTYTSQEGKWRFTIDDDRNATLVEFLERETVENLEIPESVVAQGDASARFEVVGIADGVFRGNSHLKTVSVPKTIKSLGSSEFEQCTNLTTVHFAVEELDAIPERCFYKCSSLTSVTVPASVKTIGASAFQDCKGIKSIGFQGPPSLEEIGANAFYGCTGLTSIDIPINLKTIGMSAFKDCKSLVHVGFKGASVTTIGVEAFMGCSAIQEIHLPDGLGQINMLAFANCASLKVVAYGKPGALPTPMPEVNISAFSGCSSIEMMVLPELYGRVEDFRTQFGWTEGMNYLLVLYDNEDNVTITKIAATSAHGNIVLPVAIGQHDITAIGNNAAKECEELTGLTYPDGCKISSIGSSAFEGCSYLQSIYIPSSVSKLGSSAFKDCSHAKSLTYEEPVSITVLEESVFSGVAAVAPLVIPEGIATIKDQACFGFDDADYVYLPDTLKTVEGTGLTGPYPQFTDPEGGATVRMPDSMDPMTFDSESYGPIFFATGAEIYQVTYGSWSDASWFDALISAGKLTEDNREYVAVDITDDPDHKDKHLDLQLTACTYTGKQVIPQVVGSRMLRTLDSGDFKVEPVEGDDCTSVGEHQVVITGLAPHFKGQRIVTYTINPGLVKDVQMESVPDCVWDNSAYKPEPTFYTGTGANRVNLVKGVDYTLAYEDNRDPGQASIILTGKGNYSTESKKTFTFNIVKSPLSEADVQVDVQMFTGSEVTPKPTVARVKDRNGNYPEELNLIEGQDYELSYANNVNAGDEAQMTLRALDDACVGGSITVNFSIEPASIATATVTVAGEFIYDGENQEPEPVVTWNERTLSGGTDYSVTYDENIHAGTATVTVKGKGNFTGEASATFEISKMDLSKVACDIAVPFKVRTGYPLEPHPAKVSVPGRNGATITLKEVENYRCTRWDNNVEVGTGHVFIEGAGDFCGSSEGFFNIVNDGDMSQGSIDPIDDQVYTGGPIEPNLHVYLKGVDMILRRDVDYEASFDNNVDVGEASVTVTPLGDLSGSLEATFNIVAADIGDSERIAVDPMGDEKYDGKDKTPKPVIHDTVAGTVLEEGTDYTLEYRDNVNVGMGTVIISGEGNYDGKREAHFRILEQVVEYTQTGGPDGPVKQGSGAVVEFRFTRSFDDASTLDHLVSVLLDGEELSASAYAARKGSAIITLNREFVDAMSPGAHTLTVVFDDGQGQASFTVDVADADPSDPKIKPSPNSNGASQGGSQSPQGGSQSPQGGSQSRASSNTGDTLSLFAIAFAASAVIALFVAFAARRRCEFGD